MLYDYGRLALALVVDVEDNSEARHGASSV